MMTPEISFLIGLAVLIILAVNLKVNAFIALLLSSLTIGILSGMSGTEVVESITVGFGETVSKIGIVIILGVILGKLLEDSKGAEKMARKAIQLIGQDLIEKISKIIPNLDQNIDHKEIGTPKTHRKFLGRFEGSYGPIPNKKLLGLLPMPFNTTKIKNLYCVGDSCFPGQGLNAVAFSGYACSHKIGAKLKINSKNLPD